MEKRLALIIGIIALVVCFHAVGGGLFSAEAHNLEINWQDIQPAYQKILGELIQASPRWTEIFELEEVNESGTTLITVSPNEIYVWLPFKSTEDPLLLRGVNVGDSSPVNTELFFFRVRALERLAALMDFVIVEAIDEDSIFIHYKPTLWAGFYKEDFSYLLVGLTKGLGAYNFATGIYLVSGEDSFVFEPPSGSNLQSIRGGNNVLPIIGVLRTLAGDTFLAQPLLGFLGIDRDTKLPAFNPWVRY